MASEQATPVRYCHEQDVATDYEVILFSDGYVVGMVTDQLGFELGTESWQSSPFETWRTITDRMMGQLREKVGAKA